MSEALDRFLVRRCGLTWAAVHLAIQARRAAINGAVCKRYHQAIDAHDVVTLDGVPVQDGPDTTTLICHKPPGVACSHQIEHAPLLYDIVPVALQHPSLQTIGRLDRDTTGLILLTLDGHLLQRIAQPRFRRWKRYRIRYQGQLADDAVQRVAAGLPIADDPLPCLPAKLQFHEPGHATLELSEGRNHQVKRMIAALGGHVTGLHRDRIGHLELPPDLPQGAMRPLTAGEAQELSAGSVDSRYSVDETDSPQPS